MIASKERIFRIIKTFREATVFLDHSNVVVEKLGRPFSVFAFTHANSLNSKLMMPRVVSFPETKPLYSLAVYKTLGKKKVFRRAFEENIATTLVSRALLVQFFVFGEEFSFLGRKITCALSQDFVTKTVFLQSYTLAKERVDVINSKPFRRDLCQCVCRHIYGTRVYHTAFFQQNLCQHTRQHIYGTKIYRTALFWQDLRPHIYKTKVYRSM